MWQLVYSCAFWLRFWEWVFEDGLQQSSYLISGSSCPLHPHLLFWRWSSSVAQAGLPPWPSYLCLQLLRLQVFTTMFSYSIFIFAGPTPNRVSCIPGWPLTSSVPKDDLKLYIPSAGMMDTHHDTCFVQCAWDWTRASSLTRKRFTNWATTSIHQASSCFSH